MQEADAHAGELGERGEDLAADEVHAARARVEGDLPLDPHRGLVSRLLLAGEQVGGELGPAVGVVRPGDAGRAIPVAELVERGVERLVRPA